MASFGSAAVATSLYFPQSARDRKIRIGLIGSGWYGMADMKGLDAVFIGTIPHGHALQLAMISYNTGTIVKWDNQNKQIINNPEASALLKRAYRGKYIHP